ncbi:MAG: hypothetical protein R3F11_25750 [Verrucomicrobiales bacterium]
MIDGFPKEGLLSEQLRELLTGGASFRFMRIAPNLIGRRSLLFESQEGSTPYWLVIPPEGPAIRLPQVMMTAGIVKEAFQQAGVVPRFTLLSL